MPTNPNLPEIEAEAISAQVDVTRSAGVGQRAAAAAFSQAAGTFQDLTNLGAAYGKAVNDGEKAKIRSAVDQDFVKLAADHAADPEGFAKATAEARSRIIEAAPHRLAQVAAGYVDQVAAEHAASIYQERVKADTAGAKQALQERKGVLEGKLAGFQRQGPAALETPEYASAFSEYAETVQALGNPIYGSSKAWADAEVEQAQTRGKVGAGLTMAREIYESGGLAAAKKFIEDTVNDPTLNLSLNDRQQLENAAKEEINLLNQAAVEAERKQREEETAKRLAQSERTDDLMLDAFMGNVTRGAVMDAMKNDEISEKQGLRVLQAIRAKQRSDAADARMASAFARKTTAESILAAAGGDKDAVKQATKLLERGIIGSGDMEDVAKAYHAAKNNPQIAAGVDYLSTHLPDKVDDRSGAVADYMRRASLGLIQPGKEMNTAQDVVMKYKNRGYSTLAAPLFGVGVPRTPDEVARSNFLAKQAFDAGRISQATYMAELRNNAAWRAKITSGKK